MTKHNTSKSPILKCFYIIIGVIFIFGIINGSSIETSPNSLNETINQQSSVQNDCNFDVITASTATEIICEGSEPMKISIGFSVSFFGFNISVTFKEWERECDPNQLEDMLKRI